MMETTPSILWSSQNSQHKCQHCGRAVVISLLEGTSGGAIIVRQEVVFPGNYH
jgi:uncharacterized radical SAM superfamily protein